MKNWKPKLREIVLVIIAALIGSSTSLDEALFKDNAVAALPPATELETVEGEKPDAALPFHLVEVVCNCSESQDKITNLGGSTRQPEVPYTDSLSTVKLRTYRTAWSPEAFHDPETLNRIGFCGKDGKKVSSVIWAKKLE